MESVSSYKKADKHQRKTTISEQQATEIAQLILDIFRDGKEV